MRRLALKAGRAPVTESNSSFGICKITGDNRGDQTTNQSSAGRTTRAGPARLSRGPRRRNRNGCEKFFCDEAAEYGCLQKKELLNRTWPDRNLLWPCGVTDYVELKRPKGGRYQKGQKERLEQLRSMGFTAVTLSTKKAVRAFFIKRAATLGVSRLPALPKHMRDGSMSIDDLLLMQ